MSFMDDYYKRNKSGIDARAAAFNQNGQAQQVRQPAQRNKAPSYEAWQDELLPMADRKGALEMKLGLEAVDLGNRYTELDNLRTAWENDRSDDNALAHDLALADYQRAQNEYNKLYDTYHDLTSAQYRITAAEYINEDDPNKESFVRYLRSEKDIVPAEKMMTRLGNSLAARTAEAAVEPTDLNNARMYAARIRYDQQADAAQRVFDMYNLYRSAPEIEKQNEYLKRAADFEDQQYQKWMKTEKGLLEGFLDDKEQADQHAARRDAYLEHYNKTGSRYYYAKREAEIERMEQDPAATEAYNAAKETDQDIKVLNDLMNYYTGNPDLIAGTGMDVYEYVQMAERRIAERYGIDHTQWEIINTDTAKGNPLASLYDSDFNVVSDHPYAILEKAEQDHDQYVKALKSKGYNYEYMVGYEDLKAAKKAYEEWESQHRKDIEGSGWMSFGAWLGSAAARPFQGIEYLQNLTQSIGHSDLEDLENYIPINLYDDDISNYVRVSRDAVGDKIAGEDGFLRGTYNFGNSLVDNVTNMAISKIPGVGGVLGMATTAGAAAQDAMYDIAQRGGSNSQMVLGGMVAGSLEMITEKMSIDKLFGADVTKDTVVKLLMKQGLTEMSEEMVAEVANTIVDVINMGSLSNYELSVKEYMRQGMSEDRARAKAISDIVIDTIMAGAGGFVSGSLFGGIHGAVGKHSYNNAVGAKYISDGGDVQSMIDAALQLDPNSKAYKLAERMAGKVDAGETPSSNQVGKLYLAVDAETEAQKAKEAAAQAEALANAPTGNATPLSFPGTDVDGVSYTWDLLDGDGDYNYGYQTGDTATELDQILMETLPDGQNNTASTEETAIGADIKIDVAAENDQYGIKSYNDFIGVQRSVYNSLVNDNFFDPDTKKRVVQNEETGLSVEIDKKGIYETLGPGKKFQTLPAAVKKLKVATMKHLPEIISKGTVIDQNVGEAHVGNPDLKYTYIQCPITVDGETMYVVVDIRKSKQKNKFWMHGVYLNQKSANPLATRTENSGHDTNKEMADGDIVSPTTPAVNPDIIPDTAPADTMPLLDGIGETSVSAAKKRFPRPVVESEGRTLPYRDEADGVLEEHRAPTTHTRVTEAETMYNARQRLEQDYEGEKTALEQSPSWKAEEVDIGFMIRDDLLAEAKKTGDWTEFGRWQRIMKDRNSEAGRDLQAWAKHSRHDGDWIVSSASKVMENAPKKTDTNTVMNTVSKLAKQYDDAVRAKTVRDSVQAFMDIIKTVARTRNTGFRDNFLTRVIPAWLQPNNWALKHVAALASQADTTMLDKSLLAADVHFEVGERVKATDRANYGNIVQNNGNGTYQVLFVNKTTGRSAEKTMQAEELRSLGTKGAANRKITSAEIEQGKYNEAYEFMRTLAENSVISIAEDTVPATVGQRVMTYRINAMLSKIASMVRNIDGNTISTVLYMIANDTAVPLDWLTSKKTGTRGLALFRPSKAIAKGAIDGIAMSMLSVGLDVNAQSTNSKYGAASRTNKMSEGIVGRLFSRLESAIGYMMVVPDYAFKGGVEAEYNRGIGKLYDKGLITDDSLASAGKQTADYVTFTNETGLTDAVNKVIGVANKVNLASLAGLFGGDTAKAEMEMRELEKVGLGSAAVPFAGVPTNVVAMSADYLTGLRGAAQTLYLLHQNSVAPGSVSAADQAKALGTLGKGITATALVGLSAFLSLAGVIKYVGNPAEDEENKDAKAFAKTRGQSGIQINWSAFGRMLRGEDTSWQNGDELKSLSYAENLTAFMMVGDMIADDIKSGGGLSVGGIAQNVVAGVGTSLLDMPLMSTVSDAIDSYQYTDGNVGDRIGAMASNFVANTVGSFIPNALKGVAQGSDPYQRDLYTSDDFLGQVGDQFKAVFDRDSLPIKYDSFGRPMMNEDGWSGFANANLRAGYATTYHTDDALDEIERLADEYGVASVYPRREAPETLGGIKLSDRQRDEYQQAYGQADLTARRALFASTAYSKLPEGADLIAHQCAEDYANQVARGAVGIGEKPSSWVSDLEGKSPEEIADALILKALTSDSVTNYGDQEQAQVYRDAIYDLSNWGTVDNEILDAAMEEAISFNDAVARQGMGYEMETEWMQEAAKLPEDERAKAFIARAVQNAADDAKEKGETRYDGMGQLLDDGTISDTTAYLAMSQTMQEAYDAYAKQGGFTAEDMIDIYAYAMRHGGDTKGGQLKAAQEYIRKNVRGDTKAVKLGQAMGQVLKQYFPVEQQVDAAWLKQYGSAGEEAIYGYFSDNQKEMYDKYVEPSGVSAYNFEIALQLKAAKLKKDQIKAVLNAVGFSSDQVAAILNGLYKTK